MKFNTLGIAAASLIGICGVATAQDDAPLQMGLPNDFVFANPSAFITVVARGDLLVLLAHPGFSPVISDYTVGAPEQVMEISICGVGLPPYAAPGPVDNGYLEVPTGNPELAHVAASVLSGEITCDEAAMDQITTAPSEPGLFLSGPGDTLLLTPDMITSVALEPVEGRGNTYLMIQMGPEGTRWLSELSSRAGEQEFRVYSCGEQILNGFLTQSITDGLIPLSQSNARSQRVADQIAGDAACP